MPMWRNWQTRTTQNRRSAADNPTYNQSETYISSYQRLSTFVGRRFLFVRVLFYVQNRMNYIVRGGVGNEST
ncbi:hypothetical protein [Priestia megaterium]|uniref:hypothetical protein n=1 Tax=Priestia megaterium TaxID=1404 RepID=UPI003CF8CD8C